MSSSHYKIIFLKNYGTVIEYDNYTVMYENEGRLLINVQPLQILRRLSQKTVIENISIYFFPIYYNLSSLKKCA